MLALPHRLFVIIFGGAQGVRAVRNEPFNLIRSSLAPYTFHAYRLKSLDWTARQAKFVEKVPDAIVQEVLNYLIAVF